jgi:formylglycine-generating enzyme required for sulfatase activity
VDWHQAKAYCSWLGKRLPTEAEWEYAARSGGQAITYPWGNALPSCNLAVMANGCGSGSTLAVCGKTPGNTAQGICDMAGNVWEWVEDAYGPYPGTPATNPVVNTGSKRVLRGGSWYLSSSYYLRAALRNHLAPGNRVNNAGFRCARTL